MNPYTDGLTYDIKVSAYYHRAKQNNALGLPDTLEADTLYKLVARELAKTDPDNLLIIPHLDHCITSRCNLNCKYCSFSIPKYTSHPSFNIQAEICASQNLLNAVDQIVQYRVLGGEPLLYQKQLPELIDFLGHQDKIRQIFIISNGSILLREPLISTLKPYKQKLTLHFNNYGPELSTHFVENIQLCRQADLKYRVCEYPSFWYDLGDGTTTYSNSLLETRKIFENCPLHQCSTLYRGKFSLCGVAAHFDDTNTFKMQPQEFVDLSYINTDKSLIQNSRNSIMRLTREGLLSTCAVCKLASNNSLPFLAAEQIKKENSKTEN